MGGVVAGDRRDQRVRAPFQARRCQVGTIGMCIVASAIEELGELVGCRGQPAAVILADVAGAFDAVGDEAGRKAKPVVRAALVTG